MKAPEFTRSGSSHSTTNPLPGNLLNPIRKYFCTVPDYISFLESSALGGLALSLLRWSIHMERWKLKIQTMGTPSR